MIYERIPIKVSHTSATVFTVDGEPEQTTISATGATTSKRQRPTIEAFKVMESIS